MVSKLYLADLNSGSVDELLSLENFKIEEFAVDPNWEETIIAGYRGDVEGVKVGIYAGRLPRLKIYPILFFDSNVECVPLFSSVYDVLTKTFHVAVAYVTEFSYFGGQQDEKRFGDGGVNQRRSFVFSYKPPGEEAIKVNHVDDYIYLDGGAIVEGKVGFYSYDLYGDAGYELEGYGFFDPTCGDFVYTENRYGPDRRGGIACLTPTHYPDEGCRIDGYYIRETREGTHFTLRDQVIRGPIGYGRDDALIYLTRDRDTEQAKIKAKSLETGKELVLDLPYDPEPALRSRYNLLFVR
ncbi:MAG: hypothetical protein GTN49_09740 [candidate division Zixibacteria bacterium]|nr:hypothetical protein [candidate division Zixibacteria bacterium]